MVSVVVLLKFLNASLLGLTLDGTIDGLVIYVLIPLSHCVILVLRGWVTSSYFAYLDSFMVVSYYQYRKMKEISFFLVRLQDRLQLKERLLQSLR